MCFNDLAWRGIIVARGIETERYVVMSSGPLSMMEMKYVYLFCYSIDNNYSGISCLTSVSKASTQKQIS